jgi:hypothetical protein
VKPAALRIAAPKQVRAPAAFFLGDTVPKTTVQAWRVRPVDRVPTLRRSSSSSLSISPRAVNYTEGDETILPVQAIEEGPVSVPTVQAARDSILQALAVHGGETDSSEFQSALAVLTEHDRHVGTDGEHDPSPNTVEGMWLTLTKPTFFDCLGENDAGDPMYTLGRMSFDLFSPSDMICSLQGNFNSIERVNDDDRTVSLKSVPRSLHKEVEEGSTVLRTYK